MKAEKHLQMLSKIDEVLSELPQVICWSCEEAFGTPSVCDECRAKMDRYASPKSEERTPWKPSSP